MLFIFRAKLLFPLIKYNKIYSPAVQIIGYLTVFIMFYESLISVAIGIPWTLLSAFSVYLNQVILILHLFYFIMICLYLKLKLRRINKSLKSSLNLKSIRWQRITETMFNLNTIYCEINQCNNEFWSKISFVILTFLCTTIFSLFYEIFYGELSQNWIHLSAAVYYTLFNSSCLIVYITSSASLSSEAFKTNLLFMKHLCKFKKINLKIKFKVMSMVN